MLFAPFTPSTPAAAQSVHADIGDLRPRQPVPSNAEMVCTGLSIACHQVNFFFSDELIVSTIKTLQIFNGVSSQYEQQQTSISRHLAALQPSRHHHGSHACARSRIRRRCSPAHRINFPCRRSCSGVQGSRWGSGEATNRHGAATISSTALNIASPD